MIQEKPSYGRAVLDNNPDLAKRLKDDFLALFEELKSVLPPVVIDEHMEK